jgi:hypothetical protein
MADKADVAKYVELYARNKLGMSVGRLQKLSTTDLDTVVAELKASANNTRYRVGGFYGPDGPLGTFLTVNQQINVGPMVIDTFMTASDVGVEVSTAGTEGNLYICIYADNGTGYPGSLLYTTAAQVVTGTTFRGGSGLTLPLTPGLYWAGTLVNGVVTTAPTVRSVTQNSKFVGQTAGAGSTATAGYSATGLASTPPTNFPATVTVAAAAPRVMIACGAI